ANKVGTYPLAVLAARHAIPFYVCAPTSSIDLETPDGDAIEIEDRPADEVLLIRGVRIAPAGTNVRNPAFDVTPAELITGIVTEEGVVVAPFGEGLAAAVTTANARRAAGRPTFGLVPAPGGETRSAPEPAPEPADAAVGPATDPGGSADRADAGDPAAASAETSDATAAAERPVEAAG
ncbi:MAG TPA: hypothetical protein VGO64_03785, partial [Candidatus Limnocylindrales bacterium]|nr:hypothetical protein [Candidatus Limnocylindrales bacterium]